MRRHKTYEERDKMNEYTLYCSVCDTKLYTLNAKILVTGALCQRCKNIVNKLSNNDSDITGIETVVDSELHQRRMEILQALED